MSKRKRWRTRRRVFPRNYVSDLINVGRGPNKDALALYHDRVRTTFGPKHNLEPVQRNTFTKVIPETRGVVRPTYVDDGVDPVSHEFDPEHYGIKKPAQVPPRKDVDKTLYTLKGEQKKTIHELLRVWYSEGRGSGITVFNHIVVYMAKDEVLKLFFSGGTFLFVKELEGKKAIVSVDYPTKDVAMQRLQQKLVYWIDEFSIS